MSQLRGSQPEEGENKGRTRADERRQSLVEVAFALLAEKGFEGLRVRDVAGRAGVNIATLHYYFSTKEALVEGVVVHLLDLFINFNTPPAGVQQTAAEQVRQMFVEVQEQMEQRPEVFIVLTELHLHAQRNEAVKTSLNRMLEAWRGYVESVCREGVESGLFRQDVDIPRTADIIMSLIEGLNLRSIGGLKNPEFERIGSDVVKWLSKA